MYKILTINPGSTSTKIGYFHDEQEIFIENIHHDAAELEKFPEITDQLDFRKEEILKFLESNNINVNELDAIGARGGIMPRHSAGTFIVTDEITKFNLNSPLQHPVNLAGLIGKQIADSVGINAYITDGPSSLESIPIALISGHPDIPRESYFHVLNQKAIARLHCKEKGLDFNNAKLIVVHMGGGISIGAHHNGRIIDATDAVSEGPFTPERTGSLPVRTFLDHVMTGKYDYNELKKQIQGKGGVNAYLGTNNMKEAVERIEQGDEFAKIIVDALALQIAKDAAAMSTHYVNERIDGILLTGGLSNSEYITDRVVNRLKHIAPIFIYKGERELQSLAAGAIRALKGEEELIDIDFSKN